MKVPVKSDLIGPTQPELTGNSIFNPLAPVKSPLTPFSCLAPSLGTVVQAACLGQTDIGNKRAIGGLARKFNERVAQHYVRPTP